MCISSDKPLILWVGPHRPIATAQSRDEQRVILAITARILPPLPSVPMLCSTRFRNGDCVHEAFSPGPSSLAHVHECPVAAGLALDETAPVVSAVAALGDLLAERDVAAAATHGVTAQSSGFCAVARPACRPCSCGG